MPCHAREDVPALLTEVERLTTERLRVERRWLALVATLERALNEGRNVVPDATDDEAHAVESFALSLLGQIASGTLEQSADA